MGLEEERGGNDYNRNTLNLYMKFSKNKKH